MTELELQRWSGTRPAKFLPERGFSVYARIFDFLGDVLRAGARLPGPIGTSSPVERNTGSSPFPYSFRIRTPRGPRRWNTGHLTSGRRFCSGLGLLITECWNNEKNALFIWAHWFEQCNVKSNFLESFWTGIFSGMCFCKSVGRNLHVRNIWNKISAVQGLEDAINALQLCPVHALHFPNCLSSTIRHRLFNAILIRRSLYFLD